ANSDRRPVSQRSLIRSQTTREGRPSLPCRSGMYSSRFGCAMMATDSENLGRLLFAMAEPPSRRATELTEALPPVSEQLLQLIPFALDVEQRPVPFERLHGSSQHFHCGTFDVDLDEGGPSLG